MSSPALVPMVAPDGTIGDVPHENVAKAAQSGFKVGTEMISPDGKPGVIPLERADEALKAGFTLKPPAMPKPSQPDMQPSYLATAIENSPSNAEPQNPATLTPEALAQMTPEQQEDAQSKLRTAAAVTAGGLAAGEAAPALYEMAVKHLAGNVLPGMESAAAKQTLTLAIPKVLEFAKTISQLGIGLGGVTYMLKTLFGEKK